MNQTAVIGSRDESVVRKLLEQAGQDGVVQRVVEEERRRRRQEILERIERERREREIREGQEAFRRRVQRFYELRKQLDLAETEEEKEAIRREMSMVLGVPEEIYNDGFKKEKNFEKYFIKTYNKEINKPIKKIIDYSVIKEYKSKEIENITKFYKSEEFDSKKIHIPGTEEPNNKAEGLIYLPNKREEDKKKDYSGGIVIPDEPGLNIFEKRPTLEDLVRKMMEDSDAPKQIKVNEVDLGDIFGRYGQMGKQSEKSEYKQSGLGGEHGKPA